VSYSSNSTPRPFISSTAARTSGCNLDNGLRKLPRRPGPSGVNEEPVCAISNRQAHSAIACLEEARLERL
jgi:hypothetical protein